jgi:hypothetical protein
MRATDSSYYRIVLPVLPDTLYGSGACITDGSPRRVRQAVEKLARFFRQEFGYDFLQYSADERDPNGRAYLWVGHVSDYFVKTGRGRRGGGQVAAYGACCFRKRTSGWALAWVWFHPYERSRGHLSAMWPDFRAKYGDFYVEQPLSRSMRSFLSKKRHRS